MTSFQFHRFESFDLMFVFDYLSLKLPLIPDRNLLPKNTTSKILKFNTFNLEEKKNLKVLFTCFSISIVNVFSFNFLF